MLKLEEFSVRRINLDDKDCILRWRNSENVRSNMYNDHVISQSEHDVWFARALINSSAVYLVFMHKERPIGFGSIQNINRRHERCSVGFYLGETDVPRGAGAVLEFMLLDYAFLTLAMRKMNIEVFAFNLSGIRLHEKFGFFREGEFVEHIIKNGKYENIVCLAIFRIAWINEREQFKVRMFGKNKNSEN